MDSERYARSAILLHWAIALLLLFQLGLGWHMVGIAQDGAKYAAFQFHKSIGITILVLSVARVAIRLTRRPPPPVEQGGLTAALVKLVHAGLYAFMIAGPLTGWMVVSSAKVAIPTRLFGMIPWPHLPVSKALNPVVSESHEVIAWIGLGLVAVHLAGAIRHHLGPQHSNVIGRMIPAVASARTAPRALPAALFAAALLGLAFGAPWLLFPSIPRDSQSATPPLVPAQGQGGGALPETAVPSPAVPIAVAARDDAKSPEEPTAKTGEPALWRVAGGGRLGFTAQMSGSPIDGRYERWTAEIRFAEDALARSSIVVRVPLLSANTGNGDRDEMLRGPDFFGSAGTATFRSANIRHLGGERYTAGGTLTMNGVTLPMTLQFTLHIAGNRADVAGSTKLDRTAFHIGTGQWTATDQIAATVAVDFKFHATKEP